MFGRQTRCLANTAVNDQCSTHQPGHADGQRHLVLLRRRHNSRSSSKPVSAMLPPTRQAVAHSMVRGAMRIAAGRGSSSGSASATCAARCQLARAAVMSRLVDHAAGAHVPAVGGVQITGGLQVFGDQRRVLVSRGGVTRFDRGGQPPVQLGAIRLELSFVGHGADQRMVEHVLGLSGEADLIDELRRSPGRQRPGSMPSVSSRSRLNRRADDRRRAQGAFGLWVEPVDARGDGRLQRWRAR